MRLLPSIMCADPLALGEAIRTLEAAGVEALHVDVMDGHFVPGFTFGVDAVSAMASATRLALDVHVMSTDPLRHALDFARLPVECVTIHVEATADPVRCLEEIRRAGVKAGLAVNPGTPLGALDALVPHVDRWLIMAISPGFVGHAQLPACRDKAAALAARLRAEAARTGRPPAEVYLDGGVKIENVGLLAACGLDGAVSGSGVFGGPLPIAETVARMRARIAEGMREAAAGPAARALAAGGRA